MYQQHCSMHSSFLQAALAVLKQLGSASCWYMCAARQHCQRDPGHCSCHHLPLMLLYLPALRVASAPAWLAHLEHDVLKAALPSRLASGCAGQASHHHGKPARKQRCVNGHQLPVVEGHTIRWAAAAAHILQAPCKTASGAVWRKGAHGLGQQGQQAGSLLVQEGRRSNPPGGERAGSG